MKKCVACGANSEVESDAKAFCVRHYVENECEECLHWEAVSITERIKEKRATPLAEKILAEILKKYPYTLHRENEFGEHISEEELSKLTERFRKLEPLQIDAVFHRCGFIIANHEKGYKALRKSDVEAIASGFNSAQEKVWHLVAETHISHVMKALSEAEK